MYDDELQAIEHYRKRSGLYDWANRVAALLRGTSGARERMKAIRRLEARPGDRILEICCGTGTNLALMNEAISPPLLVGMDISRPMLLRARQKLVEIDAAFVEAEASRLPFLARSFDRVFHHGGFAEFGDKPRAIAEMIRVAVPGSRIVICDVGVPTDRRLSRINRMLLRTQPMYDQPPPLHFIPDSVTDLSLDWIGGGAWYLLTFNSPGEGYTGNEFS